MKWAMVGLVAGALAVSLIGCSELSSPATDDGERNVLVQRTLDLKDKVAAVGRMTPEQRRELAALKQAVTAWQLRTGRNDISVSPQRPVRDDGLATAPVVGSGSCKPCPGYKVIGDYVCFLEQEGPCGDDLIAKVCVYTCIYIGSIKPKVPTVPITRR